MKKLFAGIMALSWALTVSAQTSAPAQVIKGGIDMETITKIRQEGMERSRVMDFAFQLTDVNGPRLTNSPGYMKAAKWAAEELKKIGLVNASLEPWGEFGKGWELSKSYVAMKQPYYKPLIAYPKTWTRGTGGLKNAPVLLVDAKDSAALEAYRGKMKGQVILLYRDETYKQSFAADAKRFTDEQLAKMAEAKPTTPPAQADTAQQRRARENFMRQQGNQMPNRVRDMAEKEGAVAVLAMSPRGHDGTLFVQGTSYRPSGYNANAPEGIPEIMLTLEDYMMMCRLARSNSPLSLEMDIQTSFNNSDLKGYNVVAEIPGTDPVLKNEIVMLGAHLDSWQAATGATDNAAGSAVMMEAVRIIKSLGLKPKRTIRIALWSGEEQGLLGSRGYVKQHFADPADMKLKPEHERLSAYYNIDNGTGKIRGIYLQGNEAVRDLFAGWLLPFHDLDAKTVTISNTGGTDHQAFDAVGLPGFQFIQDPIEYDTRTHHTNMDSYDHLIASDLKQIATIVAAFVYNTAMLDQKLPRKELPKPRPTPFF
jgi:carboxypeptidase Q